MMSAETFLARVAGVRGSLGKCFVSNFELAVWLSNKDKNHGLRKVAIVNTSKVEPT